MTMIRSIQIITIALLLAASTTPAEPMQAVNLIHDLRNDLKAPDLPVVIGEMTGPWSKDAKDLPAEALIVRKAQENAALNPAFQGTVLLVKTSDFVRMPEDSPNPGHGYHEFGNAETYFYVGDAMAKGMLKLLRK